MKKMIGLVALAATMIAGSCNNSGDEHVKLKKENNNTDSKPAVKETMIEVPVPAPAPPPPSPKEVLKHLPKPPSPKEVIKNLPKPPLPPPPPLPKPKG